MGAPNSLGTASVCDTCRKYLAQPGVGLPSDELQGQADALENEGRFKEALELYQAYLNDHPQSAFAMNNAATLLLRMHLPSKALEMADRAISLLPTYVKAWNNLGAAKATIGDITGAAAAFEKALELDTGNRIAEANLKTLATQKFEQRVRVEASGIRKPKTTATSSHSTTRQGQLSATSRSASPESRPRPPVTAFITAIVAAVFLILIALAFWKHIRDLGWQWQVGLCILALLIVLRAFTAGLNPERAQVAMVDAIYRAGRFEEALAALNKVLSTNPTNSEAYYLKGQCVDRLGRSDEAMAAWREALKHNPKHGKAAHNLACEYLNQGKYLEAAEYFAIARDGGAWTEGPSIFEQNVENTKKALIHMGRQAENRDDHHEVLRYADALVRLVPDYALAYAWRAQHRVQLGDSRAAIDDAKRCLQLDPKYDKARVVLQAAEEELNAELAKSQLAPTPEKKEIGARPASPTAPTVAKEGNERKPASPGDRPTLWKVGEKVFNRWEIRRVINRGGMGTIYAAWDAQSESPVALKTVQLLTDADSGTGRAAFYQEAEHWLRLGHHPRIVRLLSVEKLDYRHLVLVMEYVAGQRDVGPTVRDHLQAKKTLPPADAIRIALGICEAMRYAFKQCKLVHRDLKPENVFLTALGDVKVGDFGLAVKAGEMPNEGQGTQPYMAPEQWDECASAEPTLDVYAIGVILFEMICGRRPFELSDKFVHAVEALKASEWERLHREQAPPSPRIYCGNVPPELEALTLRCLAKRADERPADCDTLAGLLRPLVAEDAEHEHTIVDSDSFGDPGLAAYDQGLSLDSLGHFEEALACYDRAVQFEPLRSKRSEAWANKAKVLGQLHRFRESVAAAQRALEINPRDPHAQHSLAASLGALGSHREALSVFDRLIAQDPQRPDTYVGKGAILLDMRKIDEASAAYGKALAMKPDHQYAVNGLGLCEEARGDLASALRRFHDAVAIHDEFAEAHNNMTRLLTRLERFDEALKTALKAVQYDPQNPIHQLNLGLALHNLRRFDEARGLLEEAIRLDPRNALAHLTLAEGFGEMHQYAQAIDYGRKAAQLGEPRGAEVAELAQQCLAEDRAVDSGAKGPLPTEHRKPPVALESRKSHGAQPGGVRAPGPRGCGEPSRKTTGTRMDSGQICTCGSQNRRGNAFCNQCGKALATSSRLKCAHCGRTQPTVGKFCAYCGKEIGESGSA